MHFFGGIDARGLQVGESSSIQISSSDSREICGFTSTIVMAEVLHKLMITEIAENYKMNRRKVNQFMKICP
jgi:hypothetical protein